MTKLISFLGIIFVFVFSLSGIAVAADLSVGTWQANGYQMWRTHFTDSTFPAGGASQLYYPQSGKYITATYKNQLPSGYSFRIEGGWQGSIKAATGSDTDWDFQNSSDPWIYSEFKATGQSGFMNVDWVRPAGKTGETFYGYGYRGNSFKMTDGLNYRDNYVDKSPPAVVAGLNSSYDMSYQGPHIGFAVKEPLTRGLAAETSVTYSPLALVQGHGWWNLRNLSFNHLGLGQMLDVSAGLRFGNWQSSLAIGYRLQYLSLYRGWEDISSDITWEKATNVQDGYYVTGQWRF